MSTLFVISLHQKGSTLFYYYFFLIYVPIFYCKDYVISWHESYLVQKVFLDIWVIDIDSNISLHRNSHHNFSHSFCEVKH